jgi:LysR family hydrogen peroxide-inducible transcriptional activator
MKPQPSLRQLRHLVALVEHRHFGRAAAACLVTQSALSASLKELESVLDTSLIERTKRSVVVTPLGRDLVARARLILSDLDDLVDAAGSGGEPLSGAIRLGVIPTIGPFLLPRVLPTLRDTHPDLALYLREDQTAALLDRLAGGDLDVLLLAFPYPPAKIESMIFADDPFLLAMPLGHPLAARDTIDQHSLAQETLLMLEEGHCLRDQTLGACNLEAAEQAGAFQATSLHTLVQMVDNGLGLTLLPKMAVDAGIIRGTRVTVRSLAGSPSRQIGLAWRATSSRTQEFALLGEFFRDELGTPLTGLSKPERV